MTYDYIIVGGGTAGAVLANRLSARSANNVLLCEAGPDTPHGRIPDVILDSYPGMAYLDQRFQWRDLKVTTQVISHNNPEADRPPLRHYEQARVLGGGSSINGQLANRGAPTDYNEWAERGAKGWDWESVLPYFRKVEREMDFPEDEKYHGTRGRIPVRRIFPDSWNEHAKGAGRAFENAGFEYLPDQNGEFRDGYFPATMSNLYERRVSAAIGYLDPGTRQRGNLTISTGTTVRELLFEGTKCTGVKALVKGKETEFRANEVIVSMGAIHTPAQLLRAGIGPAMHLRDKGIDVRANRAGVGQRLMDHPMIAVASFLKPHARMDETTRRQVLTALRFSSGIGGAPAGDMFTAVLTKSAWHAVGDQIASMVLFVNKTFSETGQVQLQDAHWRTEPMVEFNLLSDRRDLERMKYGFRLLAKLHADPALRAVVSDAFPASYSDKVRQVGQVNLKNRLLTGIMARLLDGPDALRKLLLEKFIMEGDTIEDLLADEDRMEAFIRRAAVGVWHASCSCRMGAEDDPMAVADNAGRVYGVQGLRVVDASLFPVVPCANTNFPTFMAAEKISDMILAGN